MRLRPCATGVMIMTTGRARANLDGLHGDGINGAGGAHLELVGHHVAQALVVHSPKENIRLHSTVNTSWHQSHN